VTGFLKLSLVTIGVRLHSAVTEQDRIHFHKIHEDGTTPGTAKLGQTASRRGTGGQSEQTVCDDLEGAAKPAAAGTGWSHRQTRNRAGRTGKAAEEGLIAAPQMKPRTRSRKVSSRSWWTQ
jgi:hypothetical protein